VLLKNENQLLPIKKNVKSIAVIGPLANDKDAPIGNWRAQGEPNSAVSVLEGIKNTVDKDTKVKYALGTALGTGVKTFLLPLEINNTDMSGFKEAIDLAKNSELVVMVLGEDAFQAGEGRSQAEIKLAGLQQELLEEVKKVNSNIVLVLINGRPLEISWASENVPAIVEAWQLGTESGNAIADVLFGKYNPSGKLPVSFPRLVGQEPMYYNQKNTGRPSHESHVTYSHYTDVKKDALYPFGYGLSYTQFEYGELKLSGSVMDSENNIEASITLKNTGKLSGMEVVQLYLQDIVGSRTRPIKELKGFQLINLEPGESRTVTFPITKKMLEFYTANRIWEAEDGDFNIFIGGNSRDLKASKFSFNN